MKARTDYKSHFAAIEVAGDPNDVGNGVQINPAATGASPSLVAVGDDTNADLLLQPKGTGKFGYPAGQSLGGTVTQATNKSTGVTLSKQCGTITMNGAALAADTSVSFTLTNTVIAATDIVHVQHDSVGTLGAYGFAVTPGAGSAVIGVHNCTPGSLSEAIVLRFIVIKAAIT
jgi:hypothetical protein